MLYEKIDFLMWTDICISIVSQKNPMSYIDNWFDIFSSYEKEFSRFQASSDLSILNFKKQLKVSSRFLEVFYLSKEIYKKTSWFFNPLVNLKNIWYSQTFSSWIFEKS